MDDPWAPFSTHPCKTRTVVEQRIDQRSTRPSRARMDYRARGLVDHHTIFIFVKYFERDRLRRECGFSRRGRANFDPITGSQMGRRLGCSTVKGNASPRDHLLNRCSAPPLLGIEDPKLLR